MSEFKVGDTVFFITAAGGRNVWAEETFIYPTWGLSIREGIIIDIVAKRDDVFVYIKGHKLLCDLCLDKLEEDVFRTKQDCIDAFKKRLDEL